MELTFKNLKKTIFHEETLKTFQEVITLRTATILAAIAASMVNLGNMSQITAQRQCADTEDSVSNIVCRVISTKSLSPIPSKSPFDRF
jgi:predicted double-glycine peptidase